MTAVNPLFLGNPDDHCATCGTNLRANVGQHLRPCPLCPSSDEEKSHHADA